MHYFIPSSQQFYYTTYSSQKFIIEIRKSRKKSVEVFQFKEKLFFFSNKIQYKPLNNTRESLHDISPR